MHWSPKAGTRPSISPPTTGSGCSWPWPPALVGITAGLVLVRGVLAADTGTPKIRDIARAIQEGAEAFLKRQFRTIVIIVVPLAV